MMHLILGFIAFSVLWAAPDPIIVRVDRDIYGFHSHQSIVVWPDRVELVRNSNDFCGAAASQAVSLGHLRIKSDPALISRYDRIARELILRVKATTRAEFERLSEGNRTPHSEKISVSGQDVTRLPAIRGLATSLLVAGCDENEWELVKGLRVERDSNQLRSCRDAGGYRQCEVPSWGQVEFEIF